MKRTHRKLMGMGFYITALFVLLAGIDPVPPMAGLNPSPGGIDPDSYPGIGDEELGQLRWAIKIADQPIPDFTNLEASNQYGMSAYRYTLAFMTYFLAAEQYHKLPACPGIIQTRMDRVIQKILEKPVWEYWAEVSRGIPYFEPRMNKPYPEEHDPVGHRNIMYSGHLGHIIALYEMLYRDLKWSKPGAIVFTWKNDEKYVYDNNSLQRVMYDQMMNNPDHCIECEPNACFPECNQHPILSFMLYDHVHGTNLSKAQEAFLDFFVKNKMIDPETHHAASFYLVKQKKTLAQNSPGCGNMLSVAAVPAVSTGAVNINSSSADGWTGIFMHAWQPEYIERHYPFQLKDHLIEINDETARLKKDRFEPRLQYGLFAMFASEMGDTVTRDKLLAFAKEKYDPVWESGTFHYPFDMKKQCSNLTDKVLAIARANPKNGMWTLHNRPFDGPHFEAPMVEGVDFPKIVLRRAIYDKQREALVLTTEPGTDQRGTTTLKVIALDPDRSWRLLVDGREVEKYKGLRTVSINVALDKRHNIVLVAE